MKKAHAIDWTEIEAMLCTTEKLLPTNKQAQCVRCGITVYYNSSVPQDIAKICERCALLPTRRPKRS